MFRIAGLSGLGTARQYPYAGQLSFLSLPSKYSPRMSVVITTLLCVHHSAIPILDIIVIVLLAAFNG
jgi:hypothetical protein